MQIRACTARAAVVSGVLVSLWSACNSLDEPGVKGDSKLVIPVDDRPVTQALTSPPPISGGTLGISPDGSQAVIADPDRDRVSIVDLQTQRVRHIDLDQGDEPGRVVVESAARAYVALRGSGAVVTLDLVNGSTVARTPVCAAPRGLALSVRLLPSTLQPTAATPVIGEQLHVACAEGRLVTINTRDQSVLRDLKLEADLRDVLATPDGLRVSTFKTSELLSLDAEGSVLSRAVAQDFTVSVAQSEAGDESFSTRERPMQPHLAWRSVQAPDGSVLMLHQASANEEIDIKKRTDEPTEQQSSPYGGGGAFGLGCQGVVLATVSHFSSQGPQQTFALDGTVLDVDMAISPDGGELAIVEAGTADDRAPKPQIVTSIDNGGETSFGSAVGPQQIVADEIPSESRVLRMPISRATSVSPNASGAFVNCGVEQTSVAVPGQATAVAYARDGSMIVQSREPALLTRINVGGAATVIRLGGESVRDTGHELFHRNSGGGIACASCHAEGAEDGHIWNFKGQGVRRTQALHVGLQGTAPFHWAGDESDFGELMEDVFVGRMGGVHQSDTRVSSLSRFLFALKAPQPALGLDDSAAIRGKTLFESAAGCVNCHSGAKLSDNKSYDVGTSQSGERLQVPSLRAVAYRAPFLHTGCAKNLRDRFAPECGGTKHGNVAALKPAQIDDLVAYLQTL